MYIYIYTDTKRLCPLLSWLCRMLLLGTGPWMRKLEASSGPVLFLRFLSTTLPSTGLLVSAATKLPKPALNSILLHHPSE